MRPPLSVTASASMRAVACAASVAYAAHAAAGGAGGIRHPHPPRHSSMLRDGGEAAWGRPRRRLAEVAPRGHGYGRERLWAFPPVSMSSLRANHPGLRVL